MLPTGEGRFVNPQQSGVLSSEEEEYKTHSGEMSKRTRHYFEVDEIDEVIDFPMKAVRPEILDALDKAQKDKIFDELGLITPGRGRARRGDPIMVGRIVRRENARSSAVPSSSTGG